MENIKHLFFDLDHTLWDFDRNSQFAFKQIFNEERINLDFNEFITKYNSINLTYWKLYRENKISKEDLRYRRLKDTFLVLKYDVSDDFINQIAINYLAFLPNYNHLINGATEILEYLKPKYKLHIITNGFKDVQHKKIKESGIKEYFDVIVTSESVGLKKPNPRVYEFALKEACAKSDESIMIGDNLEADIIGAFNVGILPIHFKNFQKNESSNFVSIDRLLDLKQYL